MLFRSVQPWRRARANKQTRAPRPSRRPLSRPPIPPTPPHKLQGRTNVNADKRAHAQERAAHMHTHAPARASARTQAANTHGATAPVASYDRTSADANGASAKAPSACAKWWSTKSHSRATTRELRPPTRRRAASAGRAQTHSVRHAMNGWRSAANSRERCGARARHGTAPHGLEPGKPGAQPAGTADGSTPPQKPRDTPSLACRAVTCAVPCAVP